MTAETTTDAGADDFLDRMGAAVLASLDLASIYLGDRLGLYAALREPPGQRSQELAERTGLDERYVREWLEQQAVTGILTADGEEAGDTRRYHLPDDRAEVLLDGDSVRFFGPQARVVAASWAVLPDLLAAFRQGGGIPYERYGADFREGLGLVNRVTFINRLGTEWLPSIADVDARLRAQPPARVADVACGTGWSSIAMARAYPLIHVDGLDLDAGSIAIAQENVRDNGLGDRVSIERRDAADPQLTGRYDLVTIFEALHDMPEPVAVLRALRALLAPGGILIVADERAAERFEAPGDEVQRMLYGFSVLHCLPVGRADQPSAATGTVMRPAILRDYAHEAGFTNVEVLPIEDDFWRFYRLVA